MPHSPKNRGVSEVYVCFGTCICVHVTSILLRLLFQPENTPFNPTLVDPFGHKRSPLHLLTHCSAESGGPHLRLPPPIPSKPTLPCHSISFSIIPFLNCRLFLYSPFSRSAWGPISRSMFSQEFWLAVQSYGPFDNFVLAWSSPKSSRRKHRRVLQWYPRS